MLLLLPGYVICYDIYYILETVRHGTSFNRYIHEVRVSFLKLLKGLIISGVFLVIVAMLNHKNTFVWNFIIKGDLIYNLGVPGGSNNE